MIPSFAHFLVTIILVLATAMASASGQPFPPGSPQAKQIRFQLAIYYPEAPRADPLATMRTLIEDARPAAPSAMLAQGRIEKNVKQNYVVPDMASLKLFGRGLSPAQMTALQGAKQVLVMNFSHPAVHAADGLRRAYTLAEQVARASGGLLWDEATREMFSPDTWQEKRLAPWRSGLPDVSGHITIHAYRNGGLLRAITLGMAKFGLPDLVVDQFPATSNGQVGNLLNALAQVLAEGASVGPEGHLELHLARIAHPAARARGLKDLRAGARKFAKLDLLTAAPDEGDPDNRIAAIGFARYPGPDLQARQATLLSALYGGDDSVKSISHSDELQQASARAKQQLAAIEADFVRGFQPGEYLQVKAPFTTSDGGREWMWVEVKTWRGKEIEGTLDNDPFDVPELRAGQQVKVKLDQVFDYIRKRPDGSREGNTTGAIIEKMQGRTRSK